MYPGQRLGWKVCAGEGMARYSDPVKPLPSPDPAPADRTAGVGTVAVVVATVAGVWAPLLQGGVPPWHDTVLSARAVQHLAAAALGPHPWTQGPVAWPLPDSLTQSDWMGLQAVLAAPALALGADPLATYLVVAALGTALTALAAAALSRALLGPGAHNAVAAVVVGLNPMALSQSHYANLSHAELGLLGVLLAGLGLSRRRWGMALAGGLLLGGASHMGFYVGAHALLLALGVVATAGLHRWGHPQAWAALAAGAGLGAASVLPVAQAYSRFAQRWAVEPRFHAIAAEAWDLSRPGALLSVADGTAVGSGQVSTADGLAGAAVALAAGLAAVGLWHQRRRLRLWGPVAAVGLLGGVLALGPELQWRGQGTGLPLPARLLVELPGLGSLRAPVRWLRVAAVGVGLLSAAGTAAFLARLPRRRTAAGLVLAGGLAAAMARPLPAEQPEARPLPPVFAALATAPPGPLAEVVTTGCTCSLADRVRASLAHRRPLVGGLWARRIETLVQLNQQLRRWPNPESIEVLRSVGATVVIEHGLRPLPDAPGVSCETQGGHRLCVLSPADPPLPHPCSLAPAEGDEPVVALRWRSLPRGSVRVSCGDRTHRFARTPWRLLTALRRGARAEGLEVVLPEACLAADLGTKPPSAGFLAVSEESVAWPAAAARPCGVR